MGAPPRDEAAVAEVLASIPEPTDWGNASATVATSTGPLRLAVRVGTGGPRRRPTTRRGVGPAPPTAVDASDASILAALEKISFPAAKRPAIAAEGRIARGFQLGAVCAPASNYLRETKPDVRAVAASAASPTRRRRCHRKRGVGCSDATRPLAALCRALCAVARRRCPDLVFSSIALTKDTQSPLHVDSQNVGDSALIGFGAFEGGELWVAGAGARRAGATPVRFDGNSPHCTLSFSGRRYTAIFYLARRRAAMRAKGAARRGVAATFAERRAPRGAVSPRPSSSQGRRAARCRRDLRRRRRRDATRRCPKPPAST